MHPQKVPPHATFLSLRGTLAEEGADLLVSTLRAIATGTVSIESFGAIDLMHSLRRQLFPKIQLNVHLRLS